MLVLLFMPSPNRYWLCATTVWICQHCIVSFGVVIFCTSVLFEDSCMKLVYCTSIPLRHCSYCNFLCLTFSFVIQTQAKSSLTLSLREAVEIQVVILIFSGKGTMGAKGGRGPPTFCNFFFLILVIYSNISCRIE